MSKRLIATFLFSALGLVGSTGLAYSETVGRYECNVVGTANPEPLGDRGGHSLAGIQFSCLGVLMAS